MSNVRCIADSRCELGEGIFWDSSRQRLFWFDILRSRMHSCRADGSDLLAVDLPARITAAAPASNGIFIAAAGNGWGMFSPDRNDFLPRFEAEPSAPGRRTNDGRADPHGAFWFGIMSEDEKTPSGAIYRAGADGETRKAIADVAVPNAISFSPDGGEMYWTDSPKKVIWRCALSADGDLGPRREFASLQGKPQSPDGAVVDAEGFLWNAEWDGWRVVRYAPDGRIDRAVEVPVARPTCPAFGGDDLSVMYVSSARTGLDAGALEKQPQAGGIFAFDVPQGAPPAALSIRNGGL